MSSGLLLGIDEGTTAVKAALFDTELRLVAEAQRRTPVSHPRPGWVEQDPELILGAVLDAVAEVLAHAAGREILGTGLDHQGESVLAWDRLSGRPLSPVIGWQDKRHATLLATLEGERAQARSGLPLDPYFSAGKLAWLLANEEAVRRAAAAGTLRLGTLDSFLCDRLGGRFATDLSTASRTQLLAVGGRDWDGELLELFGLRREWLARIEPTFGQLGELRHERLPERLTLNAQVVDQQAALAGSGAARAGELKATYGTGVFVLGLASGARAGEGLLPTVAWAASAGGAPGGGPTRRSESRHRDAAGGPSSGLLAIGEVVDALEGGVFTAGTLLEWLSDGLGLARDAPSLAVLAASVPDSSGVLMLPALAGLGAPWWRSRARGVISGLHSGVAPAHLARAALEAIAWRVTDIVEAIAERSPVSELKVDGGLSNDEILMRIQADVLGVPLTIGPPDATVLGAALLAGVGAGVFASVEEGAALLPSRRTVLPTLDAGARLEQRERWRAFVAVAGEL